MSLEKSGLEVVKATYGSGNAISDVTDDAKILAKDGVMNFVVSSQSLGIINPAPGSVNTFQISLKINGGDPTILSKNDGEVFYISAPSIKEKEKPIRHGLNILSAFWYFLLALFISYFGMSSFKLGSNGLGSNIAGYIFLALTVITFGQFGLIVLPIGVFLYALIWPEKINFNYPL
jgi:hypothetical protein